MTANQVTEADIALALKDQSWGICEDLKTIPSLTSVECCYGCHDLENIDFFPRLKIAGKTVHLCHELLKALPSDIIGPDWDWIHTIGQQ